MQDKDSRMDIFYEVILSTSNCKLLFLSRKHLLMSQSLGMEKNEIEVSLRHLD